MAPTGQERDRAGENRDEASASNDKASEARDERSDARDERAVARERDEGAGRPAGAAWDRAEAKLDRQGSARDRQHSARDRDAAQSDRRKAAHERSLEVLDGLTGAHHREPGLVALDREVLRATRTGQSFVLAFLDVDKLKSVNDSQGHAAGDELLRKLGSAVRSTVREYDLLVRHGGDEFLCGLMDLPLEDAAVRFEAANTVLRAEQAGSFSVGLAQLVDGEPLDELIERADAAMYETRRSDRG